MAKTFNVTLWWTDGGNGTVTYETQGGILLWKPSFESIPDFVTLGFVADSPDVFDNYYIDSNGADHSLSEFQLDEIYEWIERNLKTSSGGGGGGSGNAIVSIRTQNGPSRPALVLQREDGTSAYIDMASLVQTTPEFRIGFSIKGKTYRYDISNSQKPDDLTKGKVWYPPMSIFEELTHMPLRFYELGGVQQGVTVDLEAGIFMVSVAGCECKLAWGMAFDAVCGRKGYIDPNWSGLSAGKYNCLQVLQYRATPQDAWERVADRTTHWDDVLPSDVPNKWMLRCPMYAANLSFITKVGEYRIALKLTAGEDHSRFAGYLQGFATMYTDYTDPYLDSEGWYINTYDPMTLTGTYKKQDGTEAIPPIPFN